MRICLRGEGESEWEIETAKRSIHAGAIVFSVFIHSLNLFIRSRVSLHLFPCPGDRYRGTKHSPSGRGGATYSIAYCLYCQGIEIREVGVVTEGMNKCRKQGGQGRRRVNGGGGCKP